MTDRILAIIKYFNFSPSDFAEEIGVQRSSISHLISGRNKPSLEFVQKILNRFPEINPDWILSGQGEMIKNNNMPVSDELPFDRIPIKEEKEINEPQQPESNRIQVKKKNGIPAETRKKAINPEEKEVEKIIYLYKDNTFREYFPE